MVQASILWFRQPLRDQRVLGLQLRYWRQDGAANLQGEVSLVAYKALWRDCSGLGASHP